MHEYWLTEQQALVVTAHAETEPAKIVMAGVVEVFTALRRGQSGAALTQEQIDAALDRKLLPIWRIVKQHGDGAHFTEEDCARIMADFIWCRDEIMRLEGKSQQAAKADLEKRLRKDLLLQWRWVGGVLPQKERGGKNPRQASAGCPRQYLPTIENFYRLERDRLVRLAVTTNRPREADPQQNLRPRDDGKKPSKPEK